MELSNRTLGDWLEHWAKVTPDKEYIVYSDRNLRFTWSQFNRRVDNMAKGLLAIGVERGTHVGIWSVNTPIWVSLFLALVKLGAVPVLINTCYKAEEVKGILNYADVEVLFYGIRYKTIVYEEIVTAIRNDTPKVRHFVKMDGFFDLDADEELTAYERYVVEEAAVLVKTEDTACMIFTSAQRQHSRQSLSTLPTTA